MRIGERVITKVDNQVKEYRVIKIGDEDLTLKNTEGNIIIRKFWEINKVRDK